MENTIIILHEEQLMLGNSFDVLKGMLDNSKGGFVCDPPYGISFMSKKWDDPTAMANAMADPTAAFAEPDEKEPTVAELVAFQRWAEVWLAEVYRVLMPGGIAKVFSATRTFHRIGAAMEKVGFKDIIPLWKAEKWDPDRLMALYQKAGAKVVDLNAAVVKKWQDIARATAWKDFAGRNASCANLLQLAEKLL